MLNWYLQNGKESDVVVSSRIRLARNLSEFPFIPKAEESIKQEVKNKIKEVTLGLGYGIQFFSLQDMDEITQMSLVEKHLVSPNFILEQDGSQALLLNEEENIAIMVNEEDHMRIQVMAAGFELDNLLNLAMEVDEKIETLVNYAYHDKYGFLTACPTNVGTGLRASVMVHLPALTQTGNINKVLEVVHNFGMNIRGVYGEKSNSQAAMYQISNQQTLGVSEWDIVKNLKRMIEKIIEQERLARKILTKESLELENEVYRAFGILAYAKKISSEEAKELLSQVKLGTDLGIIKELNDKKVKKLELYTKPASLQKYVGNKLDHYQRDCKRAEIIKQIIQEN